jgi:hypothetical protein
MRSGAMRGLGADKPGARPDVQLALIESTCADPGFYALSQSLAGCRQLMREEKEIQQEWSEKRAHQTRTYSNSPIENLFQNLRSIGRSIDQELNIVTHLGAQVPYLEVPMQFLRQEAEDAWHQKIAWQIRKRKDYADLEGVNRDATMYLYKKLEPPEQALMRVVLKSKFDANKNSHCQDCNQQGTIKHRCTECVKFSEVHEQRQEIIGRWEQLPRLERAWHHVKVPASWETPGGSHGD